MAPAVSCFTFLIGVSVSITEALLLIVLIHIQVPLNCQNDHISARSECRVFFENFTFVLFYPNTCTASFPGIFLLY